VGTSICTHHLFVIYIRHIVICPETATSHSEKSLFLLHPSPAKDGTTSLSINPEAQQQIPSHPNSIKKYGVTKIGIFGSITRDEQTEESDIDIAIEMAPGRKNLHNFLEFRRFLEKSLGTSIDLGIEGTLKPAIRDQIHKEIIYV
jgi:hypothetical protein